MIELTPYYVQQYLKTTDESEYNFILLLIQSVEDFAKHYIKDLDITNLSQDLMSNMLDHIAFLYENRGTGNIEIPKRILNGYTQYKTYRLI